MNRLTVAGILIIALAAVASLPGHAQKKGKERPLTTSQMMAGLVKPQYVALQESLKDGVEGEDGWKALATSAALLNESAYMMMADERCPDDTWEQGCAKLNKATRDLLERIAARDADGATEGVKAIAASCKHCHAEHKYKKN